MMKHKKFKCALLAAATLIFTMTGCGRAAEPADLDIEFTARDIDVGYEETTAVAIALNGGSAAVTGEGAAVSGGVITISAEGTYIVSGELSGGQLVVDAADTAKIQIVLNGASVHCETGPALYIRQADKVFLTLEENSENTLTDGAVYTQTDDDNADGVIFSKADLTINGSGALAVTGSCKHGIVSKDDLVVTGGAITVTAVGQGLSGKDCVKIKTGTFVLNTEGDALHSNGDLTITGGDFTISSGDDGMHADDVVTLAGGTVVVAKSYEGIEGNSILISGGDFNVTADDDGLNAAGGSDASPVGGRPVQDNFDTTSGSLIRISGGTVTVNALGDGLDSNGALYMEGGTVYVSGPTDNGNGALDYNGVATVTGGVVVAAGSAGMTQGFSASSTQYSILYNLSSTVSGGSPVTLADESGKLLASYTPPKAYQSVVISVPGLEKGATYTLTTGGETNEITLSSVVTSNGGSRPGGGGGGGGGGKSRGTPPTGEPPTGTPPTA